MSAGLAALMGILSGAPGFEEGFQNAEKRRLTEAQQAETARHNTALENPTVDVNDEAATALGVSPGKYAPSLISPLEKAMQMKLATEQAAQNRTGLTAAIAQAAQDYGTKTPAQPELSDEG